jgi:hypothetical protein
MLTELEKVLEGRLHCYHSYACRHILLRKEGAHRGGGLNRDRYAHGVANNLVQLRAKCSKLYGFWISTAQIDAFSHISSVYCVILVKLSSPSC